MTVPTRSYLKVPYDLRTAKQVERRMMIDGLRILSAAGLPISDYRYTGFGSVHFVDFVMFHKLLGVQKLTSVEYDDRIEKRISFNKPYSCVDVMIKPIGDVIPTLSRDEKHVLWLDHDDIMNEGQLEDVWQAAGTLSVGSILMVTVDMEPPKGTETPLQWKAYYEDVAATHLLTAPWSSTRGDNWRESTSTSCPGHWKRARPGGRASISSLSSTSSTRMGTRC